MRTLGMRIFLGLALLSIAMLSAVCDDDGTTPTGTGAAPAEIRYLSGNNQVGLSLSRLAKPFEVKVVDSDGAPVGGQSVTFRVTSTLGAFAGNGEKTHTVVTNAQGMTSTYLILGADTSEAYTVEASASTYSGAALNGSPVTFSARASSEGTAPDDNGGTSGGTIDSTTAPRLELAVADSSNQDVADTVDVQVRIINIEGSAFVGRVARFEVIEGNGLFASSGAKMENAATDQFGLARVRFILDTEAGANAIRITTQGGLKPITYTAFGQPLREGTISVVTSADQDTLGYTGRPLSSPRVVKVIDTYGNPIPQVPVYWNVLAGGGSVAASPTFTDVNGLSFAVWTMGTEPGQNKLQGHFIDSEGAIHKVEFSLNAEQNPDVTGPIYSVSGFDLGADTTGSVGRIFRVPLAVHVEDATGNPVQGVEVVYSAFQGGGSFDLDTKTTDANGNAQNAVRLGNEPMLNIIQANVIFPNGDVGQVQWRIVALTDPDVRGNAFDIRAVTGVGDSLVGTVDEQFSLPIVFVVTDSLDRGSPGQQVTLFVEAGGGQLTNSFPATNSNGIVQTNYILGPNPGLNRIRATIVTDAAVAKNAYIDIWGRLSDSAIKANKVVIKSGNYQGGSGEYREGELLPLPLVVQVVDSTNTGDGLYPEGFPIIGWPVLFTVYSPEGSNVDAIIESSSGGGPDGTGRLTATTDNDGLAAVRLTLAEEFGTGGSLSSYLNNHRVEAVAVFEDGMTDSVFFYATGVPNEPKDSTATAQSVIDRIELIGGDSQEVAPGELLTEPVVIRVLDSLDAPVAGATVTLQLTSGGGTIGQWGSNPSAEEFLGLSTNSQGIVQLSWRLGPGPVLDNRLTASVTRPDGTTARVTVTATARSQTQGAASLAIIHATTGRWQVSTILPEPQVVAVYDASGNPVPGAIVTFTITQGSGFIGVEGGEPTKSQLTILSNENGLAVVTWQIGPGPDLDNRMTAEVRLADGTVKTVEFYIEALPLPDTANRLVIMSGNYQSFDRGVSVTHLLPQPLVVRVVDTTRVGVGGDSLGTPISNFPVIFTPYDANGTGELSDDPNVEPLGTGRLSALTDDDGLAAVRWRLGEQTGAPDSLPYLMGNNLTIAVAVFADGTQDTVEFYSTALPVTPNNMSATGSTERSAVAGEPLTGLGVSIVDRYSNMIRSVPVSYTIDRSPGGGTLSESTVYTSIYGSATNGLDAVSTTVGEMRVSASNGTVVQGSPITWTITILPGPPSQMLSAGGNSQRAEIDSPFPASLRVLVTDQYDNGAENTRVTYTVVQGSATIGESIVLCDSDGFAETTVTPLAEGDITIRATVTINGSPATVDFNLTALPAQN